MHNSFLASSGSSPTGGGTLLIPPFCIGVSPVRFKDDLDAFINPVRNGGADNAATEKKLIDDAVPAFAEVAGVVVHRTDGIRTNSTVPAVSATDTSDEVSS
jgi:hypothetical protein